MSGEIIQSLRQFLHSSAQMLPEHRGFRLIAVLMLFLSSGTNTLLANCTVLQQAPAAQLAADYYERLREAQRLYGAGKYEQVLGELEALAQRNPADGNLWLMLGTARYQLRQYRQALEPYQKAVALGALDAATGAYQIARCYAALGEKEAALQALERALAARYRYRARLAREEQWKVLQNEERFKALAAPPTASARAQGWQGDLAHLVGEIKRVHYRYSREPLPPAFADLQRELEQNIARLSDAEIVVSLQKLLALIGDGHTLVYPFGMRRGELKPLPLGLYFFADGLFVTEAAEAYQDLVGKKVLRIGSLEPDTALSRLEAFVSRDNPMGLKWAAPVYLRFLDYLIAIGATKDHASVSLTLAAPQGKPETVTLAPPPGKLDPDTISVKLAPPPTSDPATLPRYQRRMNEPYWFEKLADGQTIYFQFNQVQHRPDESLPVFAVRLRRALSEPSVRNLIVDVRHNNGGEGTLLRELYRTLIHFETTQPEAKIYVLTGRTTFSAAQQFISTLAHLTGAIFAGEPSGSKPNRVGDEAPIVLPYSGVRGAIASGYHQAAAKDERLWIAPDIPVELTAGDYFNRRDPALDAVLEVIKRGAGKK